MIVQPVVEPMDSFTALILSYEEAAAFSTLLMNTNGHFHLPNYELHHPRHSPEYRVLTNTSLQ